MDINYVTAGAEEQMRILKQYCKTVNAIDIYFLITIFNRNKNMQDFREHVLFQEKGDGFNWLRGSYNQIIEKRYLEGEKIRGYQDVVGYGIAFDKKRCFIKMVKE